MSDTLGDAGQRLTEVLTRVHAILAEPSQWCRGALAQTLLAEPVPVLPLSESAWRWSLAGALARALFEMLGPRAAACDWQRAYDSAVSALWRVLPREHQRSQRLSLDLDGFNDYPGTHHPDIVQLAERAISLAAAQGLADPYEPGRY
jgi:hypothetical protein